MSAKALLPTVSLAVFCMLCLPASAVRKSVRYCDISAGQKICVFDSYYVCKLCHQGKSIIAPST